MQSKPTQICNLLRKQIQDDNKTNCAFKDSIHLNERERERERERVIAWGYAFSQVN